MIRSKDWTKLAGMLWFVGYIVLYAWRLPVTYQHGRYIMPAMSVGFAIGMAGMCRFLLEDSVGLVSSVVKKTWAISAALILVLFWGLGARAYGMDVAVINSEMVQTAVWIRENTDEDALIAAHDIGALGYFSEREIVDLAGLVSPEVIPFIRDQSKLADYLLQVQPDYLVTFPSWYPELIAGLEIIYSSDSAYTTSFGMDNMAVFRWE
jgi:hypothetical protein